ncbi:hypothetical protein T05_676 [Trichinella murrelli]|uniref:Uncharacterized protein n=1 Tax=Trichinella murrelli TaxID=144512 RepID=A0A0V0T644_9BILA|nr:hypothetical protein T05_676 [Trichinella murrelli]
MIITLANLKCWPSVNERRNILVGVTHPLERCGQDTGRAKTRQTPPRKIAATDNRGPKTASYAPTEKGVRWSSAFPINSQRLPMASRALFHHFSVEIALSEKGSLLAHLCRWNPPHAINSYSSTASVLASSSDSQDVAKSATPLEPRPSRDIYMRTRLFHGFGSMYTSSQCPPATLLPVRRTAPNRSVWMVGPASCRTFNEVPP